MVVMLDLILEALSFSTEQITPFKALLKLTVANEHWQKEFESPLEALRYLVETTQKNWLRKEGSERWEQKDSEARIVDRERFLTLFDQLGMLAEKKPSGKNYDYVLLLGGLQSRVEKRLDYLTSLLQEGVRFNQLVLLGGQRSLMQDKESIANAIEGATELDMMEMLVKKRLRNWPIDRSEIGIVPINAPLYAGKRPTTADAVRAWLDTKPRPANLLAISDQPHIGYQNAVLKAALLPLHFTLETVGCAASPEVKLSVVLDALARRIYVASQQVEAELTQDPARQMSRERSFSLSI
jgi:hypothetical protein